MPDRSRSNWAAGGDRQLADFPALDLHTAARGRQQLLAQNVEVDHARKAGAGRKRVEKKARNNRRHRNAYWNESLISGSSRVGIKLRFQAHFWIGKCLAQPPAGVFPTWSSAWKRLGQPSVVRLGKKRNFQLRARLFFSG
jgi:hypothetical protein